MNRDRADRVLHNAHGRKKRYETYGHAAADARLLKVAQGENCAPYRCPFSSITGGEHWHVGHTPSMESLLTIAAAIRFYGQYGLTEEDPCTN